VLRGDRSPTSVSTPLKLKTKAQRDGERYLLSGQKIWISTAQVANKMLILVRTTPLDQVSRRTEGLSLFYTDLDRAMSTSAKSRRWDEARRLQRAVHDNLPVPGRRPHRRKGGASNTSCTGMNPSAS